MSAPPGIRHISERTFQTQVVRLAKLNGWQVYHTHDSRRSEPGFPDLVMARERVVFAELKAAKGKPTDTQLAWLKTLSDAGAETHLWRPADILDVAVILGRGSAT